MMIKDTQVLGDDNSVMGGGNGVMFGKLEIKLKIVKQDEKNTEEISQFQLDTSTTNNDTELGTVTFSELKDPLFGAVVGFTVEMDHQAVQTLLNSAETATLLLEAAGASGPAVIIIILAAIAIGLADSVNNNGARIDHIFYGNITTILPR